eukprot:UN26868
MCTHDEMDNEGCPWLEDSGITWHAECNDGHICDFDDSSACCEDHDGVRRCPQGHVMCGSSGEECGGESGDFCCSRFNCRDMDE